MSVHPTAIVAKGAEIDSSVEIGPYTVIGPNVKIAKNTKIASHCNILGNTEIGEGNQIHQSVVIGAPPQDMKYKGEETFLKIGDDNTFREFVTVHLAEGEGNTTLIGDKNLFMAYVHIAHNCIVGNGIIMSNAATLAGHVEIGDRAVLGGFSGIHQFCKIGTMVMIGGMSKIVKDVPPFITVDGNPARIIGINSVGLRRNNVTRESIANIRQLYKVFFCSDMNVTQFMADWENLVNSSDPNVAHFCNFVKSSTRGVYKRTREE